MATVTTVRRGRLEGKVCVVTGAGSPIGIGWATIKWFAEEDASHIYALDIDDTNFTAMGEEFQASYPNTKIKWMKMDVCDEPAIQNLCEEAVRDNGRLDVFFVNAGISGSIRDPYYRTELKDFWKVLTNNVGSAFVALKHAPKHMAKTDGASGKLTGRGSIILTASVGGLRAGLASMAYSAGKAAAISMAKTSALELLSEGIPVRVNAVAPGTIKTNMLPKGVREMDSELSAGPSVIANAVLYLASDESDFVNGETIVVDNTLTSGVHLDKLLS